MVILQFYAIVNLLGGHESEKSNACTSDGIGVIMVPYLSMQKVAFYLME